MLGGEGALPSWPLSARCWPVARWLVWSNSWFPCLFGSLKSCGGSFFALRRFPDTKFIGLGFAIADPSFGVLSWPLLDTLLSDRRKRLQENIERFMMFNKRTRLSHSSRVKFPLVNVSVSWFLVSMYLIWNCGSELMLSNNQSRATLWFLTRVSLLDFCPLWSLWSQVSLSWKNEQLRLTLRRVCVCGNVVHMRQLLHISVSLSTYLRYDVLCLKGGSIHDDKAMLVKFFPNKSLDYQDVAQVLFIQTTTRFSVFSPVPCPCSPLWTGRKSQPRPSVRRTMPQSGRRWLSKVRATRTPLAKLWRLLKDDVSWCEKTRSIKQPGKKTPPAGNFVIFVLIVEGSWMGRFSFQKASKETLRILRNRRACLWLLLGGKCTSHWVSLGRCNSQVFSWCGR